MDRTRLAYGMENKSAIIGVSMLNPHFTQKNIQATADMARQLYVQLFFMLPDKPACHTLAGYGYDERESQQTAKRKFNVLENSCRKSIEALHLQNAHVVRWEQFDQGDEYRNSLMMLKNLYQTDVWFREDARNTTGAVYLGSHFPMKRILPSEEQIDAGVHFLLEELAFILASPGILRVEGTDYLYHREMQILTKMLTGAYEFNPTQNVNFRLIEEQG